MKIGKIQKDPWLNTEDIEALNWAVPPTLLRSIFSPQAVAGWQPKQAHDALRQPQGLDRAFNCVHLWFDSRRGDAALPR
jgi:hypothetical protein